MATTETGYHGLKESSKHGDWNEIKADYHVENDGRGDWQAGETGETGIQTRIDEKFRFEEAEKQVDASIWTTEC